MKQKCSICGKKVDIIEEETMQEVLTKNGSTGKLHHLIAFKEHNNHKTGMLCKNSYSIIYNNLIHDEYISPIIKKRNIFLVIFDLWNKLLK